ncbi:MULTISPECIES: PEP-CTERM sorting domain-containing protein [unclassified Lentimonas]|nr:MULTISPECIES: PEP-CTERM sorting domain-containing protein [unclassified Lentimonas]
MGLDNRAGGIGILVDGIDVADLGTATATVSVPTFTGLTLTVVGLNSDTGSSDPTLNSTATSMGINATGDADTDAYEAVFNQSVTFKFNQDVEVYQLDFTTFDSGEVFNFAGTTITNSALSNGTLDTFDFSTPLLINANTNFTLQATAGTIGIEAFTISAVPEPGTYALLSGICALGFVMLRRRSQ